MNKLMTKLASSEGAIKQFSHESKVNLSISLGDYNVLAKILCKNTAFLYKLKLHPLVQEELLRDVRTIRTILEKSEREVVK